MNEYVDLNFRSGDTLEELIRDLELDYPGCILSDFVIEQDEEHMMLNCYKYFKRVKTK